MLTEKFFAIAEMGHEATLWLLILLSVFSIAFILERYVSLRKVRKSSEVSATRVRETLQSNSLGEIEELARDRESFEGRALSYGLRHIKERGTEGLEEIFNSYAMVERSSLDRYLSFLATVGSNAPFIGLLGTVFGVMDAFRGLASSQGDASAVMIGISKALVATAVGLMVAIPAVIAYNYFQRQVRSILQNLEGVRDLCLAYAKTLKKGGA
ncbi:MAG: MotA/TolQ/ExbB proton channel family protein [Bdellovibrionales bacterium]